MSLLFGWVRGPRGGGGWASAVLPAGRGGLARLPPGPCARHVPLPHLWSWSGVGAGSGALWEFSASSSAGPGGSAGGRGWFLQSVVQTRSLEKETIQNASVISKYASLSLFFFPAESQSTFFLREHCLILYIFFIFIKIPFFLIGYKLPFTVRETT